MPGFGTIPIDGRKIPGIPAREQKRFASAVRAVRRRTGCTGWFNPSRGWVVWIRGSDPSRGGPSREIVMQGGRFLPIDVEATCRRLSWSRMSRREQDRDLERAKARERDREQEYLRESVSSIAREFHERSRFVSRLLSDGVHSRPSVVVP